MTDYNLSRLEVGDYVEIKEGPNKGDLCVVRGIREDGAILENSRDFIEGEPLLFNIKYVQKVPYSMFDY